MNDPWLIVETSGRAGSVALAGDGAVVRVVGLDSSRRHARDLTPAVAELLADAGLRPRDLAGVMVGVGPGSYTGLRVGLATAKALAYATGCKLVPVPTFAAIAEQAPPEAERLWVVADALQGLVYAQPFARTAAGWVPTAELGIDRFDEWAGRIESGAWVSGPAANMMPPGTRVVAEADRLPRADGVLRAGQGIPAATRAELFALEPLYLRGSSAEEKRNAAGPYSGA